MVCSVRSHILVFIVVQLIGRNVTQEQMTLREDKTLSRKRRYLNFPENSDYVATFSYTKVLIVEVPPNWDLVAELDMKFRLPSDTRFFLNVKRKNLIKRRQKREIYTQMAATFDKMGLNGEACLRRIICEADYLLPKYGKSLLEDTLAILFKKSEDEFHLEETPVTCSNRTIMDCQVSFLTMLLNSQFV